MHTLFCLSFLYCLTATFCIDHFNLSGITQGTGFDVYKSLGIETCEDGVLCVKWHYKWVRHPIMTGFIGMVTFTPLMTVNHFIFSCMLTTYIVVAVYKFEEPDLVEMFKDG